MSRVSKVLLAVYLVILLWLTLFKLSYDIPAIVAGHHTRNLNVVPFLGVWPVGRSEAVSNLLVYLPFGLLLGMTFKDARWWRLLTAVVGFSVAVETIQFILAIGITDVTDVIMNTLGGLGGLGLYRLISMVIRTEILDRVIAAVGAILCVSFILLRLLVFQVRY